MTLLPELERAWERTDWLFTLVPRDRWGLRGIELRHPFLFYVGHLPAFAWNQLGPEPFHPELDVLFARGIDPATAGDAEAAAPSLWPDPEVVCRYRDDVRAALREVVPRADPTVAHLVLEHELMHHETLLYMISGLDPEHLVRPEDWRPAVPGLAPEPEEIPIDAGPVRLGAELGEIPFGWDNEFPSEVLHVEAFSLDRHPVPIARYAAFVDAGGYEIPELWAPGDREALGLRHPLCWRRRDGGGFQVRSMFRWHDLEDVEGWPVQVSLAEARAYCRWAGRRLPTEAELHRAAFTTPDGGERRFPWGDEPALTERAALDFRVHGRTRVGLYPGGRSAWGVEELVGNGWEWTGTPFLPRAGFRAIHASYPGYSADFFDGEHHVVFGGSWATDARLVRRSFRNWYQRRYPFVFSKFRTTGAG